MLGAKVKVTRQVFMCNSSSEAFKTSLLFTKKLNFVQKLYKNHKKILHSIDEVVSTNVYKRSKIKGLIHLETFRDDVYKITFKENGVS